jgi:hypothetical protein
MVKGDELKVGEGRVRRKRRKGSGLRNGDKRC